MKSHKFFSVIWKINAIIIFIAGVFAFFAFAGSVLLFTGRIVETSNDVNIDMKKTDLKETSSLSEFSEVRGTPYLVAARTSAWSSGQEYYRKDTSAVRNYLLLNKYLPKISR
jgi:hypothetical protein